MARITEKDKQQDSLSREIAVENRRCQRLKSRIKKKLEASRSNPDVVQPIANLLEGFRDELAMLFALETASDSIREAINIAPRLSNKADGLLREQEELYEEICDIAETMHQHCDADSKEVPQVIVDRWETLNNRLRHHDAAERELIYEAFFIDIGGGD